MTFSIRTGWNIEENELARAHREQVTAGLPIADLTASNPTRCGFVYPEDLLEPLSSAAAFAYDPDPKGMLAAREAVCRYYADHGVIVKAGQIILTTSTSEAYGYLFKLLCDPGDSILVPQPGYPLFDFLAGLEMAGLAQAPLVYDHGWQLDVGELRRAVTEKTKALVLVHPNNPTGHFTKLEEAREIAEVCREFGLALIVDEVFLDYSVESRKQFAESFAAWDLGTPVFVVSGISKICGLPQMKVGWIVAVGPGADEALGRLELVADTYLSMNAPVQHALPSWLEGRGGIQRQIRERVRENLACLDRALLDAPSGVVSRLAVEGGWYAVLRIPAVQPDERTVLELLERGVWVHPGYFFGMAESGWLVVSLLGPVEEFEAGIQIVLKYAGWNMKGN
jgi:alanine-synthesizing transaminase